MKKFMKPLLVGAIALLSFGASAQSSNDNELIGKARGAAADCLNNNAGINISASVETTGICFVEGSLHRVTFVGTPNCPPNQSCPLYAMLLATVDFDCDDNVISVTCFGSN